MDVNKIAELARAIIAETAAGTTVTVPDVAPDGFVYVNPTGPRGVGKSRLWPKPFPNLANPAQGEMVLGYADRCSDVINPATKAPYWQHGRWPQLAGFNPYMSPNGMSEMLDRITFPLDWQTQSEIDYQAGLPQGEVPSVDPWISHPQTGQEVSIEGQ